VISQRDPAIVIEAILGHVPSEHVALRARLEKIRDDSFYLPPEHKFPAWRKLAKALQEACHVPPAFEWEKCVAAIIEGGA
jgi:hypothetical protein